jgi:peptidoglycan hydrolase-like protein with peptidoglycan-binding domain
MKNFLYTLIVATYVVSLFIGTPVVYAQVATAIVATTTKPLELKNNLKLGSTDKKTKGEVTKLQDFLEQADYLEDDHKDGTFDKITRAVVIAFQEDNGIAQTGQVGPATRKFIKVNYYTLINYTDNSVNNNSGNTTSSVVNNNNQVINNDNRAVIIQQNNNLIQFNQNTCEDYIYKRQQLSLSQAASGQFASTAREGAILALQSQYPKSCYIINTTSQSTTPVQPIITFTPSVQRQMKAILGSSNNVIWSRSINVENNATLFKGVTFKLSDSTAAESIKNITLYVDAFRIGTATINSNNFIVFNSATTPVNLERGTHVIELKGDIAGVPYKTFSFSIEKTSDIFFEDSNLPGTSLNVINSQNVWGDNYTVIDPKTTFTKNIEFSDSVTQQNTKFIKIGSYTVTASEIEDIAVRNLNIGIILTGGSVLSNFSTLRVEGYSLFQVSENNNIPLNIIVPKNTSRTFDIYIDAGDILTGGTVSTFGTITFSGMVSNNMLRLGPVTSSIITFN